MHCHRQQRAYWSSKTQGNFLSWFNETLFPERVSMASLPWLPFSHYFVDVASDIRVSWESRLFPLSSVSIRSPQYCFPLKQPKKYWSSSEFSFKRILWGASPGILPRSKILRKSVLNHVWSSWAFSMRLPTGALPWKSPWRRRIISVWALSSGWGKPFPNPLLLSLYEPFSYVCTWRIFLHETVLSLHPRYTTSLYVRCPVTLF